MATLAGHWRASDLDSNYADGAIIVSWQDGVAGATAIAEGNPELIKGATNGQSVVRFDAANQNDAFLVSAASNPMSGVGDYSIATVFSTTQQGEPTPLFSESFDSFTAPPGNFNGNQLQSGKPVAFGGDVIGWSKSGGNPVHAVNVADIPPPPTESDFAVMIWHDNVITTNTPIAGSNSSGQTYTINFVAGPAVYQASSQVTSATDGLRIDVLRGNGTLLATHTYLPGAWAGNLALVPDSFQFLGDGSGDIRLRIGPSSVNSGRFGGAIDDVTLTGASQIFNATFDNFTAPAANFNGLQFQSGLPVAFGGDLPGWSKSGSGTVHAVNHVEVPPAPSADYAVMIWQDNVIALDEAISGSNQFGNKYRVDFTASPAVYQVAAQQTSATDAIAIEIVRNNDTVLARHEHRPGAWAGSTTLVPGAFEYTGDGTGDVRIRIGPASLNSGRFAGSIDDLLLSFLPITGDGTGNGQWYQETGLIDASQQGTTADWGVSLTNGGQIATGLGSPAATHFSSGPNLRDGEPHAVIVSRTGTILTLSVDGVVTSLSNVNASTRDVLDMAFGRRLDQRHYFTGDLAEIRVYRGALTAAESTSLTEQLLDTYRNDPPIATNDSHAVDEDRLLIVSAANGVTSNDIDDEGQPLVAELISGPVEGTLDLQADGSFLYRPRSQFFGTDSFTYVAFDGVKRSQPATVTINVQSVSDAPLTLPDTYRFAAGTVSTMNITQGVVTNDFHPDGRLFTASRVSDVAHGTLDFRADGSFTYQPTNGFVGTDRFTYTIDDGTFASEVTEVTLIVVADPVVISEFLADNDTRLSTRIRPTVTSAFLGGQRYFDWIELRNISSTPFDIGGYHLTDRNGNRTLWRIPTGTVVPASGHIIVFASGLDILDRTLDERGNLHTNFELDASGEFLALTRGDGSVVHSYGPEYPGQFTDISFGLGNSVTPGYFATPTPAAANPSTPSTNGPIVTDVTEQTGALGDNDDLLVVARVQARAAVVSRVDLVYRVMFGAEMSASMRDDGAGGDAIANDGLYTAMIPRSAAGPGEMVRWKVVAHDVQSRSTQSPLALDSVGERRSPQYYGTVVNDPAIITDLTDLHWFIQTPSAADNEAGTRASVFYLGDFYDNIFVRSRGASAQSVNKKSYKFEFNVGDDFRYDRDEPRVTEINLNATFQDKSYIRAMLSFESYEHAGVPASDSFLVRLEQNGRFFSLANFVEQIDEDFLDKRGLDPNGALYKMFNGITSSTSGVEKKTREYESNADLQALVDGIRSSNPNRARYLFDNIDIPAMINYATAGIISQDFDRWAKNFFLYRDTNETGEWSQIPHDKDLTFGDRFFDDEISGDGFAFESNLPPAQRIAHPFQGASQHACCGQPNWMIDLVVTNPRTREMYLRRLRSLMDEQLQPPGTPVDERQFETRIDELARLVAPDAALDLAKWGAIYGVVRDFPTEISLLKTNYLDERRVYLYHTHGVGGPAGSVGIPAAQEGTPTLTFGQIEFDPVGGDQNQEYIELINSNAFAVDISGWRLRGAVDHLFKPGTVLPANDRLYVTPDVAAFRARTTGPRGGQQLFVQGGHGVHLSNAGGTIELVSKTNQRVTTTSYVGNVPSVDAFLRISEIHYNPASPNDAEVAAGHTNNDDFEFIEVMNIGTLPISLSNARLGTLVVGGEEQGVSFDFGQGTVTQLGPGERVVVVEDLSAFTFRYGSGPRVVGEWSGALSNAGETVSLIGGALIHQVEYDDGAVWPAAADGAGASLELVDFLDIDRLDKPYSWRASVRPGGTPGGAAIVPVGVVINEVRTNTNRQTDRPDAVELYNPTTAAIDIGGWYLSDSVNDLLKYRIPFGTLLPANGYRVFDENDFNSDPLWASSFAFDGAGGDEVWLVIPDANGGVSSFVDNVHFGASFVNETFGRLPNGSGRLAPLGRESLGCENTTGRVGPILITEVNYNPGEPSAVSLVIDPQLVEDDLEFVEIYNPTNSDTPLSSWRVRGGINWNFPASANLAAGDAVVLVSFDPASLQNQYRVAAFRAHYQVDNTVQLVGPFSGQISDSGEELRLERADQATADEPPVIPYLSEDTVLYDDLSPWPATADGAGHSLHRRLASFAGNQVESWIAVSPTPGFVTFAGTIPGDFTGDGFVNGHDIDTLYDAIRRGFQTVAFDLDGDRSVDRRDVAWILANRIRSRMGDMNLDGLVDARDFNTWNTNKFHTCGNRWSDGDVSGDGRVDASDFNLWNEHRFAQAENIAVPTALRAAPRAAADNSAIVIDRIWADSVRLSAPAGEISKVRETISRNRRIDAMMAQERRKH